MNLVARLIVDQEGQGIVEYALMIGLVVLIIWTVVKGSGVATFLSQTWDSVETTVAAGPS
ncbi:MAG TPA: hypothetical protein VGR30_10490 [Candidatus Binatia bacterium]|jgi:Flp pilus assembly pilin Flp|nr:hypothetical protein [Candidatus Binatia bacterium]